MRDLIRRVTYERAPRPVLEAYLGLRMRRRARQLVALRDGGGPESWIDELLGCHLFRPMQRRSEILRLAEVVSGLRPRAVCEIGAAGGGTAFIFAHAAAADATVISVDLAFDAPRRSALPRFAREGQTIHCVWGDSHADSTRARVGALLGGRPLDLLYIDGDHSYEGVRADFRMYAPLVRPGGLVVFHDIVPDHRTRYGVETKSDTGGVPQFWRELKAAGARVSEIVEDEEQDGYGLGVVTV